MLEQGLVELLQRVLHRFPSVERVHRLGARRGGGREDVGDGRREGGAGDQRDRLAPGAPLGVPPGGHGQLAAQDAGQVGEDPGGLRDQGPEVVLSQLERRAGGRRLHGGQLGLARDERHHADHVAAAQLRREPALGEHRARAQLGLLRQGDERVREALHQDEHAASRVPLAADHRAGGELVEAHRGGRGQELVRTEPLEQRHPLERRARHGHPLEGRHGAHAGRGPSQRPVSRGAGPARR